VDSGGKKTLFARESMRIESFSIGLITSGQEMSQKRAMKRQFLQMNERTVVSVLAIYSREQKVTYRDAVMKERQNFRMAARSLSRHKAVMQLPVLPLRYRVDTELGYN